jgi:hypothetical protein
MDLNKKIEEIRQQPEHIRLRYVWALVAASMFVVVLIWVFSLGESFKKIQPIDAQNLPDLKQNLEDIRSLKDTAPSIGDIIKNSQNATGEGIQNQPGNNPGNIKENPVPKPSDGNSN